MTTEIRFQLISGRGVVMADETFPIDDNGDILSPVVMPIKAAGLIDRCRYYWQGKTFGHGAGYGSAISLTAYDLVVGDTARFDRLHFDLDAMRSGLPGTY